MDGLLSPEARRAIKHAHCGGYWLVWLHPTKLNVHVRTQTRTSHPITVISVRTLVQGFGISERRHTDGIVGNDGIAEYCMYYGNSSQFPSTLPTEAGEHFLVEIYQ